MALPDTGPLSLSAVNDELGKGTTDQVALGDADVRELAGVPSGVISFADLRGKEASNAVKYTYTPRTNDSYNSGYQEGLYGAISPTTVSYPDGTLRTIKGLSWGVISGGSPAMELTIKNISNGGAAALANLTVLKLSVAGFADAYMPLRTKHTTVTTSFATYGMSTNVPSSDPQRALVTAIGAEFERILSINGSIEISMEVIELDMSSINLTSTLTAKVEDFFGKTLRPPFTSNNAYFANVSILVNGGYLDIGIDREGTPTTMGGSVVLVEYIRTLFGSGHFRVRCVSGPTITKAGGWYEDDALVRFHHASGVTYMTNWMNAKPEGSTATVYTDRI